MKGLKRRLEFVGRRLALIVRNFACFLEDVMPEIVWIYRIGPEGLQSLFFEVGTRHPEHAPVVRVSIGIEHLPELFALRSVWS